MSAPEIFECVPNVSEGRDRARIDRMAAATGAALLDVHTDADHHRSVFTLGGDLPRVTTAVRRLAEQVLELVDLRDHDGVHPRLGALDVVPFVALDRDEREAAVSAAVDFAGWLGGTLAVPVFLYGGADPGGRTLPEVRRHAFDQDRPDFGPPRAHPSFGAVAVGERAAMVALNCRLADADLDLARSVATAVRERDGGLAGVRSLGFPLASVERAQVSMNLVDLDVTGVEEACTVVRREVEARGGEIEAIELVGLVPQAEFDRWSKEFRSWAGIDRDQTVEARLTPN